MSPGRLVRVLADGWGRFFAPQPQYAMVLARIGLGAVGFGSCLAKLSDVERLFGPQGIGGSAWSALRPAPVEIGIARELLRMPFQLESPGFTWVLFGLMTVAALAFALGLWTRTSGILLLVLHAMFYERNGFAYAGSWGAMYEPFLLYTVLAPCGRHLSLDAWRARAAGGGSPDAAWWGPAIPVRLMQMHICTMYAAAGWMRLRDAGWQRGEMVFAGLTDDWFGRFDVDWFPWLPLLRLLSHVAFVLEPLAPFLLWFRGIGAWWALALMGMHLSLELLTNLGWWQLQMITVLTVFLPAAWLARLLEPGHRPAVPPGSVDPTGRR